MSTLNPRFHSLIVLLFAVLLSAPLNIQASDSNTKAKSITKSHRPNIILIMCDDLGWGDVSYQGQTAFQTPNIDSMAKEGTVFSRFYAAAPVCSPTRGSCLTGRHPFRYGITFANTGHMKPQEITLAEIMKSQGYTTGHFGKWHLGTLTKTVIEANRGGPRGVMHYSPPQDNGFDVCFSTESKTPTYDPMRKPTNGNTRIGWDALAPDAPSADYETYYWDEAGNKVEDGLEGDDAKVILDRALPFIQNASQSDTPFLAVIWFHTPHLPVVASAEDTARFRDLDVHTRNYYGCIEAMDRQVGRLQRELKELGVYQNTLQFFTSDNGPEGPDGDPGSAGAFRGRKRSLYEGGVRVPGVALWPGRIPGGFTTDFPAVTSDYLPTVLDVLNIPLPDDRPMDGVSLEEVWERKVTERKRPIGFESGKQVTWSSNNWKLVANSNLVKMELYDIQNDPEETTNLADQYPGIVDRMKSQLMDWRSSVEASSHGSDY